MILNVKTELGDRTIEFARGANLAATLSDGELHLDLRCGGKNICNRCRVLLQKGKFSVAGEELFLPGGDDATGKWVNSCVTSLLDDSEITVPIGSLSSKFFKIAQDFSFELDFAGCVPGVALAVDLGTTTIAAALLVDGVIVGQCATPNFQFKYGDNVASRISHAVAGGAAAISEMQKSAIDSVNLLIRRLTADFGRIDRMTVAGNTVMTHLFLGYSPASIGVMPFEPEYRIFPVRQAGELGLDLASDVPVMALPAIGGYVGGDITSGMGVLQFGHDSRKIELLIDIGTNCEMVLSVRGRKYASAAAAGPAFEGANISCGGRAVAGAIDKVDFADGVGFTFSVLGEEGERAHSICGSGMVDFLAAAYRGGLLNIFGRIDLKMAEKLGILTSNGNKRGVAVADGVFLFEPDIEQLLKAKAAVYAGIVSLLEHCHVSLAELDKIYLCGGFARYLNIASAKFIRMLPDLPDDKFVVCGNTSLAGALHLAAFPAATGIFEAAAREVEELSLNLIDSFESNYVDALLLGEL